MRLSHMTVLLAISCSALSGGCVTAPSSEHWSTRPANGPDMGETAWANKSAEMDKTARDDGYATQ
jgi:hypothetical protein